MTIKVIEINGRLGYSTDRSQPHQTGRYIAGFANTEGQIKTAVANYLGHHNFTIRRFEQAQ